MCQIASLFVLKRMKGRMSGDVSNFNNIETRAVIILGKTLGEHAPSYATVKNWLALFKRGDFSTWTTQNSAHPDIIDQIHKLILEDGRILAKSIAEQLGISRERVESVIHEDLDMRKLSTKWVSKCLNADQKVNGASQSSEQILEFFRPDSNNFLSRLVTIEETWIYRYKPETKQQLMEWRHRGSPRPQNFRVQKSAEKFYLKFFGIKTASSSLMIFQSAKLSMRSITHLCWCN